MCPGIARGSFGVQQQSQAKGKVNSIMSAVTSQHCNLFRATRHGCKWPHILWAARHWCKSPHVHGFVMFAKMRAGLATASWLGRDILCDFVARQQRGSAFVKKWACARGTGSSMACVPMRCQRTLWHIGTPGARAWNATGLCRVHLPHMSGHGERFYMPVMPVALFWRMIASSTGHTLLRPCSTRPIQ